MGKIDKNLGKMSTKDLKAHPEERGSLTVQAMTKSKKMGINYMMKHPIKSRSDLTRMGLPM